MADKIVLIDELCKRTSCRALKERIISYFVLFIGFDNLSLHITRFKQGTLSLLYPDFTSIKFIIVESLIRLDLYLY